MGFYSASKTEVYGIVAKLIESEGRERGIQCCLQTIRTLDALADAHPEDSKLQRTVLYWVASLKKYLPKKMTSADFKRMLTPGDDAHAHAFGISLR